MSLISRIFQRNNPLNLENFTDWHCHILYGVDDGVQSVEDSLEILRNYEEAGISNVWLTPHIMEDIPNTTAHLRERYKELLDSYKGNVKLHLASENMIDSLFMKRLEADDLLPIGEDGKTLLVETSFFSAPMNFIEALELVKSKGYYPLLAHPERYSYIDSLSFYKKLKDMGVRFQLNLMSLNGHYGPAAKDKALRMLEEKMYDRVGSDLHRQEHFDIISSIRLPSSTIDLLPL